MTQREQTNFTINGHLKMTSIDARTGEVIDVFDDSNVVLDQGLSEIVSALSEKQTDANTIRSVKVGDDVGSGTQLNPEAATSSLTEADLSEVFEVPTANFSFSYPSQGSVEYTATIVGSDVMLLYPDQPNVVYTSAILFNENGRAVTYRRFEARTISSAINIQVSWTISVSAT